MKKWLVSSGKDASSLDHNYGQYFAEDNIQNLIKDLGLEGYLSGGGVTEDSPQSKSVFLAASLLYNNDGNRIPVTSIEEVDFTATIAAKGDPGAGNEYYITAYLIHADVSSNPYSGTSTDRQYEDSYTVVKVAGATAATGAAVKPALAAGQYCICDILITNAVYLAGIITTADILTSRQVHIKMPTLSSSISVDNELCRFDGTSGDKLQNTPTTPPTLSDTGVLSINNAVDATALATAAQIIEGGLVVKKNLLNNKNIGIKTTSFGTSADGVLAIAVGTPPASAPANIIQIYAKESSDSDSLATLALELEQDIHPIGSWTASHKMRIWVNGVEYEIALDAV